MNAFHPRKWPDFEGMAVREVILEMWRVSRDYPAGRWSRWGSIPHKGNSRCKGPVVKRVWHLWRTERRTVYLELRDQGGSGLGWGGRGRQSQGSWGRIDHTCMVMWRSYSIFSKYWDIIRFLFLKEVFSFIVKKGWSILSELGNIFSLRNLEYMVLWLTIISVIALYYCISLWAICLTQEISICKRTIFLSCIFLRISA